MADLIAYQFEEEPVRVVLIDNEPWFVASDLAKALGYRDAHNMARNLHDDEKGTHYVSTPGGQQDLNVISESGMYAAIFKSRRAEAERFRRWVTSEVLPSIRKTGRYQLPGYDPPPPLALDADPARIQAEVSLVREARRLFGQRAARSIWKQRGLPAPIADSTATMAEHHLNAPVRAYLHGREFVTTAEVAQALGLDPDHDGARLAVTAAIRFAGWERRDGRRDGQKFTGWGPDGWRDRAAQAED